MIVGCYTLDLYCDQSNNSHEYQEFPQQFTGETEGPCKRDARSYGWVFHLDGKVSCPKCANKRPSELKEE